MTLQTNAQGDVSSSDTGRDEIVLFVHGYAETPSSYRGLLEFFDSLGRHVCAPRYPAEPFSTQQPQTVTDSLADRIAAECRPYDKVLLCGHSMGAVFLRDALTVLAEHHAASPEWNQRIAAGKVRILLLAATNRGYKPRNVVLSLGLEILHRWFWLTLLGIGWACWLRRVPTSSNARAVLDRFGLGSPTFDLLGLPPFSFPQLLTFLLALAVPALCLVAAVIFARKRAFAWRGCLWALSMSLWSAWGAWGLDWLYWLSVAATTVAVCGLATLLGSRWTRGGLVYAAVTAVLASLPWYLGVGTPTQPVTWWLWPTTLVLLLCFWLYPWQSDLLLENVLFGATWITGARVRWLQFFHKHKGKLPVVHLFGDSDILVDDDDLDEIAGVPGCGEFALQDARHLDFLVTPRKKSDERHHADIKSFIQLVVNHQPLPRTQRLEFAPTAPDESRAQNWRIVRTLAAPESDEAAELRATTMRPPAGLDHQPAVDRHVVILVHGIRDFGEWQETLADRIRQRAAAQAIRLEEVAIVRYGYFSAFQFLISNERDRATRSFLEAYAQVRVRHPTALVHVAAHSNGTYVVCNALQQRNGFVELHNVYFAGSVVTPRFPWSEFANSIRGRIRSDCATKDWPVGSLCFTLALFGVFNWLIDRFPALRDWLSWGRLGAGGVDGFAWAGNSARPPLAETRCLAGGHSEAIRAKYHDGIADFLLTGKPANLSRAATVDTFFRYGIIVGAALGVVAVGLLYWATIAMAAGTGPLWAVACGALLTLIVVRIAMSV